jgi:hypothetical protein
MTPQNHQRITLRTFKKHPFIVLIEKIVSCMPVDYFLPATASRRIYELDC